LIVSVGFLFRLRFGSNLKFDQAEYAIR